MSWWDDSHSASKHTHHRKISTVSFQLFLLFLCGKKDHFEDSLSHGGKMTPLAFWVTYKSTDPASFWRTAGPRCHLVVPSSSPLRQWGVKSY